MPASYYGITKTYRGTVFDIVHSTLSSIKNYQAVPSPSIALPKVVSQHFIACRVAKLDKQEKDQALRGPFEAIAYYLV